MNMLNLIITPMHRMYMFSKETLRKSAEVKKKINSHNIVIPLLCTNKNYPWHMWRKPSFIRLIRDSKYPKLKEVKNTTTGSKFDKLYKKIFSVFESVYNCQSINIQFINFFSIIKATAKMRNIEQCFQHAGFLHRG